MATQGASSFFVTRFQLKFSNNSIEWLDYTENGIVKVKLKISDDLIPFHKDDIER